MHSLLHNSILALVLALYAAFPQLLTDNPDQRARQKQVEELEGAWELTSGAGQFAELPEGTTAIAMIQDGYFTVAYFNETGKKFIGTYGGTLSATNGKLTRGFEYNTLDSTTVGTTDKLAYSLKNGQLQLSGSGNSKDLKQTWTRINTAGAGSPLKGTWRITGRAGQDGTINQMRRGPRKTLKMLTGGRFQWIAFNTETKEFSGTGGGTYTAEDGKYTENIEFFSRNPERVGASLSFNYDLKDGKWHHTGTSSTGNPINEVWEREK